MSEAIQVLDLELRGKQQELAGEQGRMQRSVQEAEARLRQMEGSVQEDPNPGPNPNPNPNPHPGPNPNPNPTHTLTPSMPWPLCLRRSHEPWHYTGGLLVGDI